MVGGDRARARPGLRAPAPRQRLGREEDTMAITPVEIRHVRFARAGLGGYRRAPVDRLLEEIVDSFEDVWRDRADLADRSSSSRSDLVRYRELEALLRTTLVSAERAAARAEGPGEARGRAVSTRRTPRPARSRTAPRPSESGSPPSRAASARSSARRSRCWTRTARKRPGTPQPRRPRATIAGWRRQSPASDSGSFPGRRVPAWSGATATRGRCAWRPPPSAGRERRGAHPPRSCARRAAAWADSRFRAHRA